MDFDAVVDHLAMMHIMRSKVEPATTRIKRILEVLSLYSFNLYYIKGKDMILSDFLWRQNVDDSNLHEIIPISFNLRTELQDRYYNLKEEKERDMIQTRSQTKASGVQLSEVHGTRKGLDPHKMPEKQLQPVVKLAVEKKPRLGQGRGGIKRKVNLDPPSKKRDVSIGPDFSRPKPIIGSGEAVLAVGPIVHIPLSGVPRSEGLLPYILLRNRPPPKPPDQLIDKQDISDTKTDIEENWPFQENMISEIYERPDKSYFWEPVELTDLIDTKNILQWFLPKQTDIDKILEIIKKKVLKSTHLALTIKEIQAGYLNSLYFKDIYQYLAQNRLLSKKSVMRKVEILAEKYILLDSLLFKLTTIPGKEAALLAIPDTCANKIITLYHSNLFAGHQGVIKTYLTINDRFFIQNLMHYLRSYIKGCHICQLNRKDKPPMRQLQTRINLNYRPLLRLSMDLKVMPRSSRSHRYILCVIDELRNYMITAPIKHSRSEEVGEALINDVISKYCVPDYMIMDLDSAFMSSLMNYLFNRLGIKIKTVAP